MYVYVYTNKSRKMITVEPVRLSDTLRFSINNLSRQLEILGIKCT